MTKRNIVHIEIPAADSAKAAQFYQALFGWKTTRDEKMDYTLWELSIAARSVPVIAALICTTKTSVEGVRILVLSGLQQMI